MYENILLIIVLIAIGAIIGGGTNLIAIRMLFRPFRAYYIGSYKIPFTPGLIPKRRTEIADQLGKLVEEHLVTPKGIEEKVLQHSFIKELEQRIKEKIHSFLYQETTLNQWMKVHMDEQFSTVAAQGSFETKIKEKISQLINDHKHRSLKDLLLKEWQEEIENELPKLTEMLLKKGEAHFQSDEGRKQIEILVQRFFETKGSVANVIGRFVQRTSPEKIISREMVHLFQQEQTKEIVDYWLKKEWGAVLQRPLEEIIEKLQTEEKVDRLVKVIVKETPIIGEWDKPMNKWAPSLEQVIINSILPTFMEGLVGGLKKHLKTLLHRVGLREIVKNQVNQFPIIRLEKMLLSIVKRELRMIAILGAVIGGIIGLIQGFVILLISF